MSSEARTITDSNAEEVAKWCEGVPVIMHDALDATKTTRGVNVAVGNEVERAFIGDTVIRNHDGSYQIFRS